MDSSFRWNDDEVARRSHGTMQILVVPANAGTILISAHHPSYRTVNGFQLSLE